MVAADSHCDGVGCGAGESVVVEEGESLMTVLRCLFMVLVGLINPVPHAIKLVQLSGDHDGNSQRTLRLPPIQPSAGFDGSVRLTICAKSSLA